MTKNIIFSLIFTCFDPNLVPKKFLQVLSLQEVRHCCKLPFIVCNFKQTNKLNLKKQQKTQFWAQIWYSNFLSQILTPLEVRHRCKLSFDVNSRKTNEPNLRKQQKRQFQTQFFFFFGSANFLFIYLFFLKNLASSVIRYHGQLSSLQYQKKLMTQF